MQVLTDRSSNQFLVVVELDGFHTNRILTVVLAAITKQMIKQDNINKKIINMFMYVCVNVCSFKCYKINLKYF